MSNPSASVDDQRVSGLASNDDMAHHCHWPGCSCHVPPAMWGCKPHWRRLPPDIRARIWENYRPGQEIDKHPSQAYVAVAREAHNFALAADAAGLTLFEIG